MDFLLREVAEGLWSTPHKRQSQRNSIRRGQEEGRENIRQGALRRWERQRQESETTKDS
jgi:hypothetical protein